MKRGFAVIILILAIALVSCAGGSKNTLTNPSPNGQAQDGIDNNDVKSPDLPFTPEEAAKRMPSSGFVPDEVLVKTGLDKDELNTLVAKYGYSVESKAGNYARVKVADENLPKAIAQLNREQAIYTTTVNGVFRVPTEAIPLADLNKYKPRVASFAPQDGLPFPRTLARKPSTAKYSSSLPRSVEPSLPGSLPSCKSLLESATIAIPRFSILTGSMRA